MQDNTLIPIDAINDDTVRLVKTSLSDLHIHAKKKVKSWLANPYKLIIVSHKCKYVDTKMQLSLVGVVDEIEEWLTENMHAGLDYSNYAYTQRVHPEAKFEMFYHYNEYGLEFVGSIIECHFDEWSRSLLVSLQVVRDSDHYHLVFTLGDCWKRYFELVRLLGTPYEELNDHDRAKRKSIRFNEM